MLDTTSVQSRKKWYVYTLACPNGEIFYIGKGTGNRVHQHEIEAARSDKVIRYYYNNPQKCKVIREIWAQGGRVKKEIVFETDEELDAYIYEWTLINLVYQCQNLTNSNNAGITHLKPHRLVPEPKKSQISKQSVEINGDVYYATLKACDYLHVSRGTLDQMVQKRLMHKCRQGFAKTIYYSKVDLDNIKRIRSEKKTTNALKNSVVHEDFSLQM